LQKFWRNSESIGEKERPGSRTRRKKGKKNKDSKQNVKSDLRTPVPALTSVAGLVLGYTDEINGSALVIARNHPWKSLK
jgi:hypothetical protein